MNRLDWLASRDERARATAATAAPRVTVEQVLDRRGVVVLRMRRRYDRNGIGRHELVAFTARFDRIEFDYTDRAADDKIRASLIELLLEQYPHIDFSRDHDVYLNEDRIMSAPDAWEPGFTPEDDQCFGGGPAVYVACGTSWADPQHTPPALAAIGATS